VLILKRCRFRHPLVFYGNGQRISGTESLKRGKMPRLRPLLSLDTPSCYYDNMVCAVLSKYWMKRILIFAR